MDNKEKYVEIEEKTHQYHDKIFKKILDDKNEFTNFINNYLEFEESQEKIKADEIEKYNRNFITEGFKVKEADIIYKIKEREVFIIVEHQSTIDYKMAERMTKYCLEIIRSIHKEKSVKPIYPLICPIVLYTGDKKWNAPTTIGELQEEYYGFPPLEYPKYNLIDINEYSEQELLDERSAISKAMLFEKIRSKEEFKEKLELLLNKRLSQEEKKYILLMLKYSNQINKFLGKEKQKYIEKFKGDGSIMTKFEKFFIEILEDEREEGKREAMNEAKNTLKQIIGGMLKKNMTDETITEITQIDEEELQEIKKELETV